MKVFLTGATGYIGSEVAGVLLKAGHAIVGLTHSPQKAQALSAAGVKPVVGDLRKPETYRKEAAACDVLIHTGFEFGSQAEEVDRIALEALLGAAGAGQGRLLLYTSGVWVLGSQKGASADEQAPLNPAPIVGWRPAHERMVLEASGGRMSAAVIRPGCVYGGQGGLYGMMLQSAVEKHVIEVVGPGTNRWAAVYLDDLADLYRLLVEKRPAKAVYHATDGSAEPVREVAEAFLDAAGGGEVEDVPLEEARKRLGPLADSLALDQRVSSEKAARELGWKPTMTSVAGNAMHLLKQWREKIGPASVA